MTKIKRIGVLTGGGDCPGLNAAIRAVTKSAVLKPKLEVIGIQDGFLGAIEGRFGELTYNDVSGILTKGGTILGSNNRVDPFSVGPNMEDLSDKVMENFHQMEIDGLVVIGGDGTLTIAQRFFQKGLPLVAIPKTIDNDVPGTEWTIGFHSAVAIAGQAIDALHSTAESHHRVMVVEVMGRSAGWIALYSGLASGGDVVLLPEIPYDISKVCQIIAQREKMGRTFSIVVVAEGATSISGEMVVQREIPGSYEKVRFGGIGKSIADQIENITGKETRVVVLGHLQRSGIPIEFDRLLATLLGEKAVQMLINGDIGKMTGFNCGEITAVEIAKVLEGPRKVPRDFHLVKAARSIGTHFGD